MAYDVAGTAAYMTMLSIPYAGTAMATASFADDTTAMLLNKHPDMKASDARAIAAVAAPIQVGIEQLQRLQVLGRVPIFNQLMNKLAGPGGNAAVRFGLYGGIGALVEYTEEKLQDAAPLAVQALASALKQDIPQANLDGFELLDLRTFLAVAPFALIGAGVNVSQDKAAMRLMVSDEAAMRAVGISEDGIQSIQAAGTVEAQTQAIQQAWATRDATAPADERWQETVRKAAAESQAAAMNEAMDMQQAAGVQEVKRATDGSMHITLGDGTVAVAGDALEGAVIIEQAADAAQGWDNVLPLTQMLDALDARPDAPVGAIETTFEQRDNFTDLVTRYTDIANDETLQPEQRAKAANYLESLYTRAPIYETEVARQAAAEGRDPEKIDWRKVTVAGQSAMEVRDGVATAVIRIDKGASPYTVLEETSEADVAAMEREGMTVDGIAAEIRELERRVAAANPKRDENDKRPPDIYLSNYTGTNPKADRMAVVEAVSRLVQVYATGTTSAKSRVAGVLREFRKTERAKLVQAEKAGVAPRIMEYLRQKTAWLKLVISQAIRLNRARRAAREAGEEFPLERFLQRVTGVAVETQAAEEVTDAASEMWDDEGLSYIPPEDDELTPFSFQPSEPAAENLTSFSFNAAPLQLSALHNLTEDGLRYADKLGGLAVPSIAVVPTGNAIRGFGDVTLIGGRSLADPETNPVFNLDAYTARFPRPDYKAAPVKKADALMKRIKPFSVTFDDGIASEIWDGAVNYPDPVKSADRAKYSRAAKAWFLSEVAGVEVQPIRQEYKGTGWLNHPAVAKAIDAGAFDLDFNDEAGRKAFGDAIREAVTDFYSNTDPAVRSRLIGPTVKRWVQDDGLSVYNTVSLKREFDRMGKMELDVTATEAAIDEAMKGREIEFADWVTAQIVGIHDGPRIRVKGKLQPYTLDNIVGAMTSGKTAAAEQTMTMGENKVRALAAQRFTDLEKMRTAAASSIKTEDEVDAATKAIREKLAIWRQEAAPFWKYTSAIDSFDAAMEAMASVMRGAITGKRMHSAMQKAGFTTIPQSLSDRGAGLARELYDSPVPYFESKPQRAVRLSEFSGAVIRDDASPETRAILEANGIRAVEIPAASSNDINVRGAAAAALASELNVSFSFQPTAILDDLAAKVEARMSRSPQARLDAVRAAVDNLAALKQAWQRRRDGAGISDDRSKASIDAEADVRQAFRAAELMQQAGISYATAREIVEGRRRTYEETLARETHARGVEDKTAQAIRREAATRQAFKRDELLQKVDEDFAQTLSTVYREFGFWDGPALNFLSRQDKGSRKGTLMSYSKAKRFAGKGAYVNPAIWDGSHELPRSLFAGTMQPDVAAQELFSAHPELFPAGTTAADVTPDMMWEAIGRELRDNKKMAKATKAYAEATRATAEESREWAEQWEADYKAQLEAARMAADAAASAYVAAATNGNEAAEKATAQAAKEAAAWKRKALTMQNQDWGSKETLVRAMRTLDAILSAFPAAVRGKVGGWLALARIGTQDRMAEEIDRRITILDRELERELRKDALEELDALRERAKPKREAGKKPTGKLGAEAHRFFERIEAVADLTADEVEAAGLTLDTLAAKATTPDEQADIYERQQILDYFGGLDARDAAGVPLHDAQALASALATAEHVYEWGRNQWRTQEEARLAEVQAMAQEVTTAVGAAPLSRILAQGDAAKKLSGMLRGGSVSLRSFREVLHIIMGRDNLLAKQWADRAMDAMHARTDELADIRRRWRAAMEAATGQRRHKAEARVWDMGTKRTVAVTVRPGRPISDTIPIDAIPNLAGLGYNAAEIADAEAAFLALPADSRAKTITITRWQKDTEEAVSLTDAEAVYYSMLWRQEQYRENLNRAGLGQETQDEIEAGMSAAAKSLRQFMADEYAAGYYPLASLFRGMFGVDLPQIANYAPGKWWSRGVERPMDPSGAGMVEGGFRAGMLKDRKAHLAEPKPENAFALWLGHVSQTAHWKAVAPLARELRGVFGHPEVKKAITARHGAETLEALSRWMDAIEANGVRTNFPAWAQTLLGWQANVKLAWKVGTILKQSTGLIAAAYRMPLKAYASGMRRLVTGQIDVQEVWSSPMIQRRLESGFAPEVRAAMSRTFTDAPTLRRRFVQQGMELIGYADAFFATASAAIHYDWQLSQIREAVPGISDAAAKAHAMRETQLVVNATAQPVEITERSLVEMGGFGKVFLIFGSEARQKSSMWITAWARVLRGQAREEDWRTLAIMHLIVGPMVQVISSAWMDARDDDDDEWFDEKNWSAWDFIRSAALGPMAGIPIVRDLTDGFSGDSGPTAQTAKAMQSAVRIVKGPEDSEDEAVEWYAQRTAEILKGADSFTAVAAGIGEQVFRIGDNLMDTREETQAKIDRLTRKVGRTKDEGERQEILERIAGLRERLK
jgi:hypothetical protein